MTALCLVPLVATEEMALRGAAAACYASGCSCCAGTDDCYRFGFVNEASRQDALACARAVWSAMLVAAPAAAADGMITRAPRLMPAVPTGAMRRAGWDSADWGPPGYDDHPNGAASPEKCHAAMAAAAPDPTDDPAIVERLARVIYEDLRAPFEQCWPSEDGHIKEGYRGTARAVLALFGAARP